MRKTRRGKPDQSWTPKPLDQPQLPNHQLDSPSPPPPSTTDEPILNSGPGVGPRRRNFRWGASRNRRRRGAKPGFVQKSEMGSLDSELGSLTIDEGADGKEETEDSMLENEVREVRMRLEVGNNNHLFCGACQVYFCDLCREIARCSTQHYGPKGCKQHTVDSSTQ